MPCLFLCNTCACAELRKQERVQKLCSATLILPCEKWTGQHDKYGTKESNPCPPKHQAGALFTELQELMESEVIYLSSHVTGILYTSSICNVKVVSAISVSHIVGMITE